MNFWRTHAGHSVPLRASVFLSNPLGRTSLLEPISLSCQIAESRAYHGKVLAEQRRPNDLCHLIDQNVSGAAGAQPAGWQGSEHKGCSLSSAFCLPPIFSDSIPWTALSALQPQFPWCTHDFKVKSSCPTPSSQCLLGFSTLMPHWCTKLCPLGQLCFPITGFSLKVILLLATSLRSNWLYPSTRPISPRAGPELVTAASPAPMCTASLSRALSNCRETKEMSL